MPPPAAPLGCFAPGEGEILEIASKKHFSSNNDSNDVSDGDSRSIPEFDPYAQNKVKILNEFCKKVKGKDKLQHLLNKPWIRPAEI